MKITKNDIAQKYMDLINMFEQGDENVKAADFISALHKLSVMYGHDTPKEEGVEGEFKIVFDDGKFFENE